MWSFNTPAEAQKILRVPKLYGFSTVTIVENKSVTKPVDVLITAMSVFIAVIILYLAITFQEQIFSTQFVMADYGTFLTYVATVSINIVCIIYSFIFRHLPWKIVLLLNEVDLIFGDMRIDYKRISNNHVMKVYFFVFLSLPVTYFFYWNEQKLLKTLLYFYAGLYYVSVTSLVILFASTVFIRLRNINENLQLMLEKSKAEKNDEKEDVDKILKFIQIFGKLTDINSSINLCYGIIFMLCYGLLFCYSIFTIFMTFKDFWDDGKVTGITLASDLFGIYFLSFDTALIYFCYIPRREGEKTVKLANEILKSAKDETKIQMLITFSSSVNRDKFNFSCGLFDFDWVSVSGVRLAEILVEKN